MAGKLKALELPRLTQRGKYPDGGGLYLVVESATSQHWTYRYWFKTKERWIGLGSFKDVSLAEARLERDRIRLQVKGDRSTPGVDVVEERKQARAIVREAKEIATLPAFRDLAEEYIEQNRSAWSDKHATQWPSSLKTYAYPFIGDLRLPEIKPSHIRQILAPIWIEKRETANRVRGRIETIIAKNADIDDKEFRNPAEMTKSLREALPRRPKHVVEHHPALPYSDAPAFVVSLRDTHGASADALRLLILTACRTGEVLGARPEEFDLKEAVWTIPAERMKMGVLHRVPLSAPAVEIVTRWLEERHEFLFPGQANAMLSNMAILAILKRMERTDITAHGFRATFATWAEECTEYPDAIREAALAHKYKNEVMSAYQRGDKLEKRRVLMNDWAAYVVPAVGGDNVVKLRA